MYAARAAVRTVSSRRVRVSRNLPSHTPIRAATAPRIGVSCWRSEAEGWSTTTCWARNTALEASGDAEPSGGPQTAGALSRTSISLRARRLYALANEGLRFGACLVGYTPAGGPHASLRPLDSQSSDHSKSRNCSIRHLTLGSSVHASNEQTAAARAHLPSGWPCLISGDPRTPVARHPGHHHPGGVRMDLAGRQCSAGGGQERGAGGRRPRGLSQLAL